MTVIKRCFVLVTIICCVFVCGGWGFLVHKTVEQLAVYELPRPLQKFFYRNLDYIVYNSVRPDVRRNKDSTEAPKHFIDLEMYGDSAAYKLPLTWDSAVAKFTIDTLKKYGYVPYQVVFSQAKLTAAFRLGNSDSILFYAADLGHYIGDANVPLHTSVNYDGQLTNQKGLHNLWESTVPEIELANYNLHPRHKASYIAHPAEDIMTSVRQASALLPDVFAREAEVSAAFTDSTKYKMEMKYGKMTRVYTDAFAKAYAASLKNTVNDQLLRAANQVADFWYTAWKDAGSPDVSSLIKPALTHADKKALRKERRAFRKNELLEKNLLRARPPQLNQKAPE